MTDFQTVNTRDMLRNQKQIFRRVKISREPLIVLNKKQPQVAIIPVEDLSYLQRSKETKYTANLLQLAEKAEIKYKNTQGPKDLSENLDHYTWGGPKK